MIRLIFSSLLVLFFSKEIYTQTLVYAGTGMSMAHMNNEIGRPETKKDWMTSPNISLFAKSKLTNNFHISLGVIYNFTTFNSRLEERTFIDEKNSVFYSRFAIPLMLNWKVDNVISLKTGMTFNSLYREEIYSDLWNNTTIFSENFKPDIMLNFGLGVSWNRIVFETVFSSSMTEPNVSLPVNYWTIDFNVFYRILSSEKE